MSVEVPEVAQAEVAEVETQTEAQPVEVLSVTAHANRYSEKGKEAAAAAEAAETPEQKTARQELAAQQKRDRETGQFDKGKVRHKAESQKATPADVPRINQLTARAKTAEERAERAERELAELRAAGGTKKEIAQAEQKVETAIERVSPSTFTEPEPTEDDPKFAGDYGKYLRAVSAWEGRKAYHEAKHADRIEAEKATKQQTEREAQKAWTGRMEAARDRYDDFDTVAFASQPAWLDKNDKPLRHGVALDSWIMEHRSGPDVLYYFQSEKNRQELDSLLAKPMIEQLDHLALLSQRLLPSSSSQAGVTGSAAGRTHTVVLPPKPPNPVRTEAQRTTGGPPPTDGSLGVLAHARTFKRS